MLVGVNLITKTTNGFDERMVERFVDFVTEIFDVDFDGVGKNVGVVIPNMID